MNFFKKKKAEAEKRQPRTLETLFKDGQIFDATEIELKNAIKEIGNTTDQSLTIQNRNLIRALVINNIQNQRHFDKADLRNLFLTAIIILLTAVSLWLAYQQTNYADFATRGDRIAQERAINNAVSLCKISPQALESGLYDLSTGIPAPCSEVLQQYK